MGESKWKLDFISRKDFKHHVSETIKTYNNTLKSIGLVEFNNNIIDPIKLTFDSKVYNKSVEEIIKDEIFRQRDKTNTNAIGYFHQNLFKYIKDCEVPQRGFDVVYNVSKSNKIYVEMKNKHNTMNSSSSQKTFMRMLNKITTDKKAKCFLVEIIAKRSQNIVWKIKLDGDTIENEKIRRVSIDKFYELVTGNKQAFYLICKELPIIIDEIISENKELKAKSDTVVQELMMINKDTLKAFYLLAFKTYEGFENFAN